MSLKRSLAFFLLAAFFPLSLSAAPSKSTPAVLTSVSGKVTVLRHRKTVTLHRDSKVQEGETLTTASDATATLRFFDGSELQAKPGTRVVLSQVRHAGGQDKVLKFKLLLGKIFAKVQKLASSRSSFEVEAGGVVCGVRGTQYEVDYDPDHGQVDIFVTEGSVWANSGGQSFQYGPGGTGHFHHGQPGPTGGNDQGHKGKKGNQPPGPPDTPPGPPQGPNAFLGLDNNKPDPFRPLTGGADDAKNAAGHAGNDQLLGLGAHSVILQFKYPEQ